MTYSLNTLQSSSSADAQPVRMRAMRFAHEITLIAGFVALLFWLLAMFSFTPSDAAWSTSGTGGEIKNWGGRIGAWITTDLMARGVYRQAGFDPAELKYGPVLGPVKVSWVAASHEFPKDVARRIADAIDQMRADDSYQAILKRYR